MSWFTGDDGKRYEIFGAGGGSELAERLEVPLLGQVPLVPQLREGGDDGRPIVVDRPRRRGRPGLRRHRRARSTSSWPPPAATTPSSSSSDIPFLRAVISRNGENRTQNRVLRTIPRHAGRHRWRGPALLRCRGCVLEPTDEEMVERPTLLLLHGGPGFDHSASGPTSTASPTPTRWCTSTTGARGAATPRRPERVGPRHLGRRRRPVLRRARRSSGRSCSGNSFGGFVAIRYAARHPDHPAAAGAVEHAGPPPPGRVGRPLRGARRPGGRGLLRAHLRHGDISPEAWIEYLATLPAALQRAALAVRPPSHVDEPRTCSSTSNDVVHRAGPARRPRRRPLPDPRARRRGRPDDAHEASEEILRLPAGRASARLERFDAAGTAPSGTSPSAPSRCSVPS